MNSTPMLPVYTLRQRLTISRSFIRSGAAIQPVLNSRSRSTFVQTVKAYFQIRDRLVMGYAQRVNTGIFMTAYAVGADESHDPCLFIVLVTIQTGRLGRAAHRVGNRYCS